MYLHFTILSIHPRRLKAISLQVTGAIVLVPPQEYGQNPFPQQMLQEKMVIFSGSKGLSTTKISMPQRKNYTEKN